MNSKDLMMCKKHIARTCLWFVTKWISVPLESSFDECDFCRILFWLEVQRFLCTGKGYLYGPY